jgi:hypothetical protein
MSAGKKIIDGSHPEMKAIFFNQENIDCCCGNRISFTKIIHGFVFVPGMKRVHEMLQDKSGYNFVPGTAVCLTTSKIVSQHQKVISAIIFQFCTITDKKIIVPQTRFRIP